MKPEVATSNQRPRQKETKEKRATRVATSGKDTLAPTGPTSVFLVLKSVALVREASGVSAVVSSLILLLCTVDAELH